MWRLFKSPPWDDVVYWALDLETSGLDPVRNGILSVGMVPVRRGRICLGEAYYSLVALRADHHVSQESMAVHHILPGEAAKAPPVETVLDEVLNRLGPHAMLVHFKGLDVSFLKRASRSMGRLWPAPVIVDTARLLVRYNRRRRQLDPHAKPISGELGAARRELGLPPHTRHHALNDAIATAELFLALRHRLNATRLRHLR